MKQENSCVLEHRLYQGDYRLLKLSAPLIGPLVQPGQFVHVKIPRLEQAVLRRPFSVFKADASGLSILYKTVGKGTAALTTVADGEPVNLIGPLGTGFPTAGNGKTPVLVAGGYGNAALYLQAARLPVKGVAFFGGRTSGDVLCVDEFEALGWEVRIATDDGSLGRKGFVTAALDEWLAEQESGVRSQGAGGGEQNETFQSLELFACGPNAMLRAVGDRALAKGLTAWLSMDRNMACGVGACLTCVIKRKTAGGWEWARCCKDGPVFNAEEILWED
ncbi:MAG: dihydroorotate dehydrogenase electron transfer subunit [Pontiellaceae bacterium]|jgi:dihydroorotate dehydrogenase electron transfer subunit|nr:dihydroorotate dehydrogenase electron transfer subunit [Pontiellaceae bacterium]